MERGGVLASWEAFASAQQADSATTRLADDRYVLHECLLFCNYLSVEGIKAKLGGGIWIGCDGSVMKD